MYYVGRENNSSHSKATPNFNKIHVYVNDNINNKESMMNYTDHSKNKKLQDYMSSYNREVMMSEYVTIPKSRLRRLIITEVLAWGIVVFVSLVSFIR